MSDDVTVIQADREAAAPYMGFAFRRVLEGECDTSDLVQRFAKHRQTFSTPSPDSGERMRDALEQGRPFSEWHEDHGDVLWWKLPIMESPYCGSPIDLGRSMKVVVQIGFEEHDLPITMTGGWPFSDDDEASLWWTPLPKPTFMRAALQESAR